MEFSKWERWIDRNLLLGKNKCLGIYCIAYSKDDISNSSFSMSDTKIVYFGMTNSDGGLKSRLQQFHITLKGTLQHGGADRLLGEYQLDKELFSNLYVAVWQFDRPSKESIYDLLITKGEVARAEYVCFAEYHKIHNNLPKFNNYYSPKNSRSPKEHLIF